ncbi:MAG: hypothetical protein D6694_08460 [Gammaproteobacteria bacterium]|nr:MAG: hypothetical protein D6694_08460 [Gammaproteobacteria bacterium]
MDIKKRVLTKFNQVTAKYKSYFSRPVYKFIRDISFGILRSGHVHLSKIGSALEEKTSLKKTTERLSSHLGRVGLDKELTACHLEVNKRTFRQAKYLIGDMSDINKAYAEKMEGLGRVHDGSSGELCNGYWQFNIIGVDEAGTSIMPMLSTLFATDKEGGKGFSENKKILESVATVSSHLEKEQIFVYDRGGDRIKLMMPWIKQKQYFIIRQTGLRHIYVNNELKKLKEYAKRINRPHRITVHTRRRNRLKARLFECGARQVYLPREHGSGPMDTALWLVSAREPGKGWCWYLCFIPAETEAAAVRIAMQGYGYRWKIEEVHRQIKSDYHLEDICLRRYTALKNFNVLFWMTMSFLYQHMEGLSLEVLQHLKVQVVYRRHKLKEYIGFVYYKLAKAVKIIFAEIRLRRLTLKDERRQIAQLCLALE